MIHKNIRCLRLKKNWTQEDLASKLGVTRQTISKWEQGINEPDISTLQKLSVLFEVSIDELLGKEESIKKSTLQDIIKICNLVSIAMCIIFSLTIIIFTRYLNDQIPMHWNIKGEIDRYASKWEWLIMIVCFLITLFIDILGVYSIRKKQNRVLVELWILKIACWICQITYLGIFFGASHSYLKDNTWFAITIAMIYAFLLPICIFFHPCITPSNRVYGVRTKFTLSNPTAWNLVNRFSCYVLSLICVISIIFNLCFNSFWLNYISSHFIIIGFILIGMYYVYVKRKLK